MDFDRTWNANQIEMYSDASKNPSLGFGVIRENSWMYRQWDSDFIINHDPSIGYLKLFGVVATVLNWLDHFSNRRIILHCDNQSVVAKINNMTSSCKNCLQLIRLLVLHSMKCNIRVFTKYISSRANRNSDLLSRLKIKTFLDQKMTWDKYPTGIPTRIWPMSKVWIY